MSVRGISFNKAVHWLWDFGRLSEFFTIDTLNRIEIREMEYIKRVQRT